MPGIQRYTLKPNRLKKASFAGFSLTEDGKMVTDDHDDRHYIFLPVFDCGEIDGKWGRFRFQANIPEDMTLKIRAIATNHNQFMRKEVLTDVNTFLCDDYIDSSIKLAFFELAEPVSFIDKSDVLLYSIEGRYMWVCIELDGVGHAEIWDVRVFNPGDTFMNIFPEVYIEWNSFFHRYLSTMSSLYNDFQDKIMGYAENLDVETASPELLEIYAGWMGIDVSGNFLDEKALRTIVREGPELNRRKGTKAALVRMTEIVLGDECMVVEKKEAGEGDNYGTSVYDVTILVKAFVDEKKKAQLFFLLQQFVPIRTKLQIIYLAERSELDTYSYLDINASIFNTDEATLDNHLSLDGNSVLSE